MIAYLEGKLSYKEPTYVVIDIQGVGYQVFISLNTFSFIKGMERTKLHTYLHIREDAQLLYGFSTPEEKKLFLDLISISGVGPNTGLVILSSLSPEEIQQAIINENTRVIQSVKGIGAKTAQRIILELKDKMKKEGLTASKDVNSVSYSANHAVSQEALSALVKLGINKSTAEKSIQRILKKENNGISVEDLVKMVLKAR
ncbi:Holliday junction branch migration protein RuvA [Xanthovirga aplysinae]|uniref:Holliday junction branch migration protein RuvA n=1 Tax=Xanthovirga aplysinae TaxID=2529853 RepID=UPI0012BC47ED|nr:Holliday junction branch migration protein RuvA [Xanthovirga aplysinae]MTI30555.1 Holliday junction branch migration protein RuvA [Xanthovirga aplysinae]